MTHQSDRVAEAATATAGGRSDLQENAECVQASEAALTYTLSMMRRLRWWASLCGTLTLLGCSEETPLPAATGGAHSAGSAGAGAGAGGGTTGGTTAATAGSAGQSASGSSMGGASGGAGAAGAGAGGMAGTGGLGGASGSSTGGTGGMGGSGGGNEPALPKRVLLYHFSTLAIASVPAQLAKVKGQLEGWGFEVVDSVNPADINATNLATFGGVAMINTCFEPFGAGRPGQTEAAALKTFVENGGGLFGTHCASVTYQSANPPHPYNQVIGGRGNGGSFEEKSACRKTTEVHVSTDMLPATFDYTGNLDATDYTAPDTKILVMCKWSGGAMKDVPVSWYRTPGKGRVFYTNFAKEDVDYNDATLGPKHILSGLRWTLRL